MTPKAVQNKCINMKVSTLISKIQDFFFLNNNRTLKGERLRKEEQIKRNAMYVLARSQRPSGPGLDKIRLNFWCEKPLEWICSKQRPIHKGTQAMDGGGEGSLPVLPALVILSCLAISDVLLAASFSACIFLKTAFLLTYSVGKNLKYTPKMVRKPKGRWKTPELINLMKIKLRILNKT